MTAEFNLIEQYFTRENKHTDVGIGDDAALMQVSSGHQLVASADMSVVGTHFFEQAAPYDIGWKSLAVNLSDMAAMGAQPKWAMLSLAMPSADAQWLRGFSDGFFNCANQFNVDLIGGDTTRGPLNIAIQIMGEAPTGKAILRSGAQADDDIWVSGQLGSAALGLAHLTQRQKIEDKNAQKTCLTALNQPQPRVTLGVALRGIAHSCIDLSDGLLADLNHILEQTNAKTASTNIGASIALASIPCLPMLQATRDNNATQQLVLAGGDDYELCFTASPSNREVIAALAKQHDLTLTRIGAINTSGKLSVTYNDQTLSLSQLGYDHFS